MHTLILEPGFDDSPWCKQILDGLRNELKKRREEFCVCSDASSLTARDTVFVIGSVFGWLRKIVALCNAAGVTPIVLCTALQPMPGCRFHCVCSDIAGSMGQLTAALKSKYGQRIALYGINPDSVGDRGRKEAFLLAHPHPEDVFDNSGSLAHCYDQFAPHAQRFDAVICANGFAAVSLSKRLPGKLPIISCVQTLLSRSIPSVDMNFHSYGKAALGIADLARKQPRISGITAAVEWSLEDIAIVCPGTETLPDAPEGGFYDDSELQRMLRLENMLSTCDDTDMTILYQLLQNQSYSHMAEICYLTEGAVKYRIKNMRTLCRVETKEALTALLREYLTDRSEEQP